MGRQPYNTNQHQHKTSRQYACTEPGCGTEMTRLGSVEAGMLSLKGLCLISSNSYMHPSGLGQEDSKEAEDTTQS